MGTKLLIFSLAITVCNGHIPILGDLISATHKVAGTILEGITHGHHFNVDGSAGFKTETSHQSNYKSTSQPEETVIIVVENGGNSNEYSRSPGNYRPAQHNQKPSFNSNEGYGHGYNEYRPNHNTPVRPHTHHGNENFNNNYYNNIHPGGFNNGRPQNYYDNNQHQHQQGHNPNRYPNYPNQENHYHGNHQYPPQPNGNNGFYDQNNGNNFNVYNPRPNTWNNNNGIPSQPPPFNGNNQQNNGYPNPNNNNGIFSQQPSFNTNNQQNNLYPNDNNNNGNANSDGSHFVQKPTTGFLSEGPFPTIKPTEKTKTPDNDVPLFIPLLTDENKNTAPKRETDDNKNKPAESQEEEFELDVRIKE